MKSNNLNLSFIINSLDVPGLRAAIKPLDPCMLSAALDAAAHPGSGQPNPALEPLRESYLWSLHELSEANPSQIGRSHEPLPPISGQTG